MKFCTLASGSSGNSVYIETENTKILVDAGISLTQITKRLLGINVDITDLDAVIITHEHTDHSVALPKLNTPTYVAYKTTGLWKNKENEIREFDTETTFLIGDLLITPFSVPHDALDPVGFTVENGKSKLGIITDAGSVTKLMTEKLKGSNALILEFNHDTNMLINSPYPWELKQRIKSRLGHLSNDQASQLLMSLLHRNLLHVVIAHLSKKNNDPELALDAAMKVLTNQFLFETKLTVAPRNNVGEVLQI